jgi:oligopeptidase A
MWPAHDVEARDTEIQARLLELARLFAANVRAATCDFTRPVANEAELAGMSGDARQRARRQAQARGLDGFLLTLEERDYRAAISSLDDRALRKTLYEAYHTRASDRGPRPGRFDNTPVLGEMLELRHELALLRGFENYAQLALSAGVHGDPDDVERRLLVHHRSTKAQAQAELDQLWAFAKQKGVPRGFSNWDLPYYAAWLDREEHGVTESEIREYFALDMAIPGALALAAERLGLSIAHGPETDAAERRVYRVADLDGTPLGRLELDVFGHDDAAEEERVLLLEDLGGPRVRVDHDFERALGGASVQLTHREVEAVFRGVGRALFFLVTRTPAGAEASHHAALGSAVAGRYFERFASHFDTLKGFARQRQTGLPLPHELFRKLQQKQARYAAIAASQELELSLFDLRVHRDHVPRAKSTQLRAQVLDTFIQIRREQSVLPPSYWTRFANSCMPIFVHDRAARLWERDWARRMGSELFDVAEERGPSHSVRRHWRDTFWAPGERDVSQRLQRALGRVPPFGGAG